MQEEKTFKGVVLYTDGSCKLGNPGFIGWGVHGYIYHINETDKPVIIDNNYITDKGYLKQDQLHDAKHVTPTHYVDFTGSSLNIATNNVAELTALCNSLEYFFDKDVNAISIYTDSEYLKKGLLQWCPGWERNSWKKEDGSLVTNCEWWIRIYDKYKAYLAKEIQVSINWVRSHSEIFGNTHADILAGIGSNYSVDRISKSQYKISEAKDYWKTDIEKHPFLNFKRVYFNSVAKYNFIGNYFQADNGGADVTIGKRIPETGFAVIRLTEPDFAIEAVKEKQYEIAKDQNAIIMMKLDRIFSKEIYPYLLEHGKYCLKGSKGNLNVDFFDQKPVCVEINPTGLSMRAVESFNLLEDLLDKFILFKQSEFKQSDPSVMMNAHDVTDKFYDTKQKKDSVSYTLKPEFTVGFKDFHITIQEKLVDQEYSLIVPLILGTDMLARNNLKKLEDYQPTIYLVTWRISETSIRYAVVIECDNGIGIWSNFFSDRIFFPK